MRVPWAQERQQAELGPQLVLTLEGKDNESTCDDVFSRNRKFGREKRSREIVGRAKINTGARAIAGQLSLSCRSVSLKRPVGKIF